MAIVFYITDNVNSDVALCKKHSFIIHGVEMKRIIIAISLVLAGCSATQEQQSNRFDSRNIDTKGERILLPEKGGLVSRVPDNLTVRNLKSNYKEITGEELLVGDTLECGWDENCYKQKYLNFYNDKIGKIQSERVKQLEKKMDEERAKCEADAECRKQKYISSAVSTINMQYRMLIATNPYNQAEADAVFRRVCRGAGEAQRSGVSEEKLIENINLIEGIPPQVRQSIVITARSCWTLSKYGVSDGTVKISTRF